MSLSARRRIALLVGFALALAPAFTGAGTVALASADGRVFAVDGENVFSRGFHSVVVEEDVATVHTSPDHPAYSCPGPDGMTVSEGGKVEWQLPKDFAEGLREVRVRLRDSSGREATHSFQVRVE
jgi:hypothetical protein